MKSRGKSTVACQNIHDHMGLTNDRPMGKPFSDTIARFVKTHIPAATLSPLKWQKKRQINHLLMELLSSNVSLSAAARMLRVNPKTVAKKLLFLGAICEERNQKMR